MHRLTRRQAVARLSGGLLTSARANAANTLGAEVVELNVAAIGSRTLRVSLLRVVNGRAERVEADPAMVLAAASRPLLKSRSITKVQLRTWGQYRIAVSGNPLAVSIEDRLGKQIQRLEFDPDRAEIRFGIGTLPLFGLGEGGPQYDRRGHEYTMRNGQYNPDQRIEGGRMPIPWVISPAGWGLFFHSPFGITDLKGPEGKFTAQAQTPALPVDIFIAVGSKPAEMLREYAELTGYPHLPPLWSFGYQQSHRTLESREEVMSELREFRQKKLPCDTMIYLGTGFCPSGWNTGHGSFRFNEQAFPDPAAMIDEMHREHFHIVLHLTQPPERLFGTVNDTGATANEPDNAAHYWSTHRDVSRLRVDGWWPDEGDRLNPASRLARDRLYWDGPVRDRPNVRPFSLNRNGYAGIQRYGWLWTGDVNSDWRALAAQIPVGINTGLTGMPYWGTDIGGFIPTLEFTAELYVRWFQFGTFCPLFRSHGRTWKLHLPWGWNTGDYGPVEIDPAQLVDRSHLHNPDVEPICRKYLELRYQLLPYLYSVARESHETGMPIIRAMWLHYPDDREAIDRGDQYLWGREILVAPVTSPGASTRRLYLPRGDWYDFWTGERMSGGRQIERPVDLQTLPLYVRAGAILPFGPVKQYVEENVAAPLTIRIYPGADGCFVLYSDDGVSFDHERGQFMRLMITWNDVRRELRLELGGDSKMMGTGSLELDIRLLLQETGRRIQFNGNPIVVQV
jgi:alpha-glucosidase (family GH31 glycosyl hydrolase)